MENPIRHQGDAHAVVALILRDKPGISSAELRNKEMFYILRAVNEQDRWSGQVGFPGGRKKQGESDVETAIRETFEEVGLDLSLSEAGGNFEYLGRLNDRLLTQGKSKLVVSCLVFNMLQRVPLELKLDAREVAACAWAPIEQFLDQDCTSIMFLSFSDTLLGRKNSTLSRISRCIGANEFAFTRVFLQVQDVVSSKSEPIQPVSQLFMLWGITLGFTSEFLVKRGMRSLLEANSGILFKSQAHNFGIKLFRTPVEAMLGRVLAWDEIVVGYLTTLGLIGSSTIAGATYHFYNAKL